MSGSSKIVLGVLAGHDQMDSTTVPDEFVPFDLPDNVSLRGVSVGIPKVCKIYLVLKISLGHLHTVCVFFALAQYCNLARLCCRNTMGQDCLQKPSKHGEAWQTS